MSDHHDGDKAGERDDNEEQAQRDMAAASTVGS
jgi:hypothetical protein